MLKKIEALMAKYVPWVYLDGISSLLHAIAVAAAYLVPGLSIGFALGPIPGLVAGIAIGGFTQYWYYLKEFGPKGDLKKIKAMRLIGTIGDKEFDEKKRDAYRDFGMSLIGSAIGISVLWHMVG